jgi:hypothetical protein
LYGNKLHSLKTIEVINFEYVEYLKLSVCNFGNSAIFRSLLRFCKRIKYLSLDSVKFGKDDSESIEVEDCGSGKLDYLEILNY